MADLGRRDFLKMLGLAGTTAAVGGCSEPSRRIIPYVISPEDIIPGQATWYASTCRECPAGCGMLAKNRDGRIIKVEGNPLHPVSGGKLCVRGQASLHGLYNPDRFGGPLQRTAQGKFEPISWDKAEELFVQHLAKIVESGRGERIVFITDLMTGTMKDLTTLWLAEMGNAAGPVLYEPFAYEPLRKANQVVFGFDGIPSYHIDQADFLISFNAGFLETWISNVEYARQFSQFHSVLDGGQKPFAFVGPRLSMTANNADLWVPVPPGGEYLFALGMLRVIIDDNLIPDMASESRATITTMAEQWPLARIVAETGVDEQILRGVARQFAKAQKPLALAEGLSLTLPHAAETAVAANLLCAVHPGSRSVINFAGETAYTDAARAEVMKDISERMRNKEVDLLLIHRVNPVFSLPLSWDFRRNMEAVPMVVSFSSMADETSASAHMVLPTHTPLESWGDYSPRKGVVGIVQPVMGPMFNTRHLGDILISTGRKIAGQEKFPRKDFYAELRHVWEGKRREIAPNAESEVFWLDVLKKGGAWDENVAGDASQAPSKLSQFTFPGPGTLKKEGKDLHFIAYPTVQFFDGRGANRPWIQELPDPMTQITWGGWVEIHPETAAKLGVATGDMLRIKSPYGVVDAPAFPVLTVPRDALAMPIGQGHTDYGRFANGLPANPMQLLPPDIDPSTGGLLRPLFGVTVVKTGENVPIANTAGSYTQQDREFVETVTLTEYHDAVASGHKPHISLPLPEGYDPAIDFYPPHEHAGYRWAMVVDLDRCIGCSACVVACYAENNVAIVGKEQALKGREMSWMRIQRYFDEERRVAWWLPMFCQHCDRAPCEPVCPVYAPHHSKDGLNNQVYNRCFGTRFCSQNDPYKVRRFNFFTYTRPAPLDWQLNPDVTVRQKGVMEKCSFCVQRIIDAKTRARNEGRQVLDGEFTTACAQTCPTNTLIFGNLLDPNSRVSQLVNDVRAYQVLGHLNTKPAVIYLKRVTHRHL